MKLPKGQRAILHLARQKGAVNLATALRFYSEKRKALEVLGRLCVLGLLRQLPGQAVWVPTSDLEEVSLEEWIKDV